jgi:type I restriction enzyme S subunit
MTGSAGQKRVPTSYFANTPFPLPPLSEQKRIVAKVDELMKRCDELETRQKDRADRHKTLVASCLNAVTDPKKAKNSLPFIALAEEGSFNLLFSFPESITELRKTILQLAVQGRLVPQDPRDTPAEKVFASRIAMSPSSSGGGDVPFEVPITWRWIRLGQVGELINGDRSKNYPNKVEYVQEGVPWINTGHIEPDGKLSVDSMHHITRKKFDSLRSGKVRLGDLVYCLRGATLGKTAIITQFDEGAVASSLVIIRLSTAVEPRFAYRYLTSPLGRNQIFKFDNGSAQPNLSANNVRKYWFPLPPLAEQKRIVSKVNELMVMCDNLEAKLTQSSEVAEKLAGAVVNHMSL